MSTKSPVSNSPSMMLTSSNPDAIPRCTTHRKRLKFFCSKHELLLCSVCAVKKHRTCEEVLTISEASEDKKVEGRKLLESYSQRVTLIDNAIVERKAAKKLLETNVQEIQNEIHEVTEKLMDLIKHEERTLLENVTVMQTREAETLDKDIGDLEQTCGHVRKSHDHLAKSLKYSDVELIHAVIKEMQQDGDQELEQIVKKSFREVDFKFIVSPHVTSFLRHFKNLGQVMLSDESSRTPRSNMSTPVSELLNFSSDNRFRPNDSRSSTPQQTTSDEAVISAREKWQRDRQRHMHAQIRDRDNSSSDSVFTFDMSSTQNRERRNLPMRALPRPTTPDFYNRSHVQQPQRREVAPRPMSTPPVETPMFHPSPKSRDVDRYNTQAPRNFRTAAPPQSLHVTNFNNQNGRENIHHSEPVHIIQKRRSGESNERAPSPWATSPQSQQQQQNSPPSVSVITVKEDDFGRSFAIQINDNSSPRQEQQPPVRQNGFQSGRPSPETSQTGRLGRPLQDSPTSERTTDQRRFGYADPSRLQETGSFIPSTHTNSRATDEEKFGRWVHQTSFSSSGIGAKRMISGIGLLNNGGVVLVDQEQYSVQQYDHSYKFVTEMKLESRPYDVIPISDNKFAVSLQSERMIKFILITSNGLTTVADLNVPCDLVCYGICRGGGHYCICCGDEVWVMSEEGRVIKRLKKDKNGNGLFVQAEYVAMDRSGEILFVSDAGNNNILAIHVDGRRLWEFTYHGFKPCGVRCNDQYVYVCDRDQHRILMLNMNGQVVKQSIIGKLDNPRAMCFNDAGNQLIVSQMRYEAVVSPPRPVHVYTLQC